MFGVWWWYVNRVPNVTVALPPTPSPNGFDTIVAAYSKIVDSNVVNDAVSHYSKRTYSLPEQERVLRENGPALKMIHDALSLPIQVPIANEASNSGDHSFAYMRQSARLLDFAGHVCEEENRFGQAADYYLQAMELGVALPTKGTLVSKLLGNSCEAFGHRGLNKVAHHLSAVEARSAVQRLETMEGHRVTFSQTLETDKTVTQAEFLVLNYKI